MQPIFLLLQLIASELHPKDLPFFWGYRPDKSMTPVQLLQMCTGFHPEKLGECATEFVHSYAEALIRFHALAAKGVL